MSEVIEVNGTRYEVTSRGKSTVGLRGPRGRTAILGLNIPSGAWFFVLGGRTTRIDEISAPDTFPQFQDVVKCSNGFILPRNLL